MFEQHRAKMSDQVIHTSGDVIFLALVVPNRLVDRGDLSKCTSNSQTRLMGQPYMPIIGVVPGGLIDRHIWHTWSQQSLKDLIDYPSSVPQ